MIINITFENNKFLISRGLQKVYISREGKEISSEEFILMLLEVLKEDQVSNKIPENTKATPENELDIYRKSTVIKNIIENYILGIDNQNNESIV